MGLLLQVNGVVLGILIVVLASVCFCLQNVIVRVLFNEHTLLGWLDTGGFVTPNLPNSFLLLAMRMVLVVPLMSTVAATLYPGTWTDLQQLGQQARRITLVRALGGGLLMYLYLALLYIAIGLIPTGVALTLFFTFPVFTALLSWGLLGHRPTRLRWAVIGLILVGSILTVPSVQTQSANPNWLGSLLGVSSGFAYALYTVNAQKSMETLHPVPFTWISFVTTLGLSVASLLLWPSLTLDLAWGPLWLGGFFSAIATASGHLLYNSGIRLIGATTAAMIGASNPALTVLLAWVAIAEGLSLTQLMGVLIVTFSVILLSQVRQ